MALTIEFEKSSISTDCGTIIYTDNTGNYDVSTNPTGYGAPNETRANLYFKIFLLAKKSAGEEFITLPTYTPNTVSTLSITIDEDCWYNLFVFATKAYDAAVTYPLSAIIFNTGDSLFYRSIQAGNIAHTPSSSPLWWTAVTDYDYFVTAYNLPQSNVYVSDYNSIELCNSIKCEADALLAQLCACDGDCGCGTTDYEKIRMKIEAIQIHAAREQWSQGQEILEDVQGICQCLD